LTIYETDTKKIANARQYAVDGFSGLSCFGKSVSDDVSYLLSELANAEQRAEAAEKLLDGIEGCLICMPGGAGCNAYGSRTCYRTRRGPQED
jgi:hypothetical protein